jgi:hypothetical protein
MGRSRVAGDVCSTTNPAVFEGCSIIGCCKWMVAQLYAYEETVKNVVRRYIVIERFLQIRLYGFVNRGDSPLCGKVQDRLCDFKIINRRVVVEFEGIDYIECSLKDS